MATRNARRAGAVGVHDLDLGLAADLKRDRDLRPVRRERHSVRRGDVRSAGDRVEVKLLIAALGRRQTGRGSQDAAWKSLPLDELSGRIVQDARIGPRLEDIDEELILGCLLYTSRCV